MASSGRKQFPTKFVWDHGGSEVRLAINGGPPIHLQREDDGTFEVTTSLGQGRYEYCFAVDGTWTHDPDLPTIKNSQGCYNNLLKIVDAKDVVANKAPNVEKVEEATKLGVANFVEKCFSDAALHETVQREKLFSAGSFSNFSSNFSENEDQRSEVSDDFDDFPDLDEALDLENPIFITESPLPNRSMKISEKAVDTHDPPRRQDTWQNALDCIVQHSQSMSSVFSQSNQQQLSPTPPVSIDASATTMRNPTPTTNSPLGHLTQTPSLDITKPDEPQDESIPESVSSSSNNKTPSVGIPKISAPSPSQVFSPALPSAHPLSSTNPQLTATSVEDSPANSSSPVLHSADDRSAVNGNRSTEEEDKDRPTEPRVVEVDLSTGKSELISTENDPLFKIDSVKKLSSLTAKRESGSPVNPEEDRSASVGNVDKLCLVNATRSEQSQLTGGVAKTGDDLQVQPNCEVPVTKGNVMDSASTNENRDLEVTVGHICERDSVPDKQAADPENESSLEGRNPGVAELSMQNSSDGQSCPPRITNDRKSNETSVKHELSPAAQVNLRDEKPKSTVEDEISTEYVNDSNDDECIQEIREIAGQSEASQKGQGSKLIDEMLLFNLNEMGKRRDLGSDQMNATPQNLEEKDRAGMKSEPLVKQYEENKDGLEEMVQVLPESSPAVGHGIDDVKTFSPTPMSEEKMIDAKSTALEVIQIAASEEKDFEATLQKAAPEVREEVLEKNVVDQFLPIVQASVTESVGLEVIQDEPNVKNKAEIDIIQNLPNSEEVCTKSADTTDVEVTVPALEKEETSTDLPEMTEYATNEKEITSRRIEEDPRENGNVSESHKHLVDVESVSRDFDCSNLEFEASPGLAAASEISRKDATDSQMSPADKKEDPPVQQVLLPDGIKSSDIQITSESDEQTDDPPETLSTQQGSVKDNAVENPKSDHLTQSLTIESEKGIKDEEASTADNESKNISERVPLVRTEEETNLKSTTSEKSVDTNLDTKPDVKAEEFQNEVKGSSSTRDMFSQINNTLLSISKSKSNVNLHIHELAKSASTTKIKVEEGPEPPQQPRINEKDEQLDTRDMNKNLVPLETKVAEPQPIMSKENLLAKKREEERERMERMKMSRKLDAVFGVIRKEPPVEEVKTEIKIRGMGDVTLDRKAPAKKIEQNKVDEFELKRAARQQIAMPDKPATYKKAKAKPKEEPPKPEPPVSPITIEKIKAKKSCLLFVPKPPSPPRKEKSPDLQEKFWPRQKLPTPETEPEPVAKELTPPPPSPAAFHSPLKIGINGFDRMGRLAFRAAFQSGLDVTAVNDPFIPLHYMVYSLKFDMAHCPWSNKKCDLKIEEGPSPGQIVVNGKIVQVYTEMDPSNIPWRQAGVNYVIEATESLKTKVSGAEHLKPNDGVLKSPTMKDLVNRKGSESTNGDQSSENPGVEVKESEGEKGGELTNGVRKVVLASNSTDVPSIGIGINEDRLRRDASVISSISAPANALLIALKVIQEKFGLRFCAYTFIKAIKDVSREIKCPPLGPKTHSRSQKWDFGETLVPAPCPLLEEETFRFLPSMRGRLHGMVVYTPVPEVSMFDLTIGVENESRELYQEVCATMEEEAEGKMSGLLKYVVKVEDETSASCLFTGCPHSVVFDARSGCQIDQTTIKIVLWFDNEYGFAHRVVDLVKKAYRQDCGDQ